MIMTEISVFGENSLHGPWGWEICLYLFLGGLVAGLMIISGVMRLMRSGRFPRALFLADLTGLPLLGVGMLFLLLDLSNKANLWRFYTTFQVRSPMSWGAWALLLTMALLALRFVSLIPEPKTTRFLRLHLFPPPPAPTQEEETDKEETAKKAPAKPPFFAPVLEWVWKLLYGIAGWVKRRDGLLALIGVALGAGVGFYTGVLLSAIASHPLWNTAILAPLFLISGLASGGAFLCLFLPEREHKQLVPLSILFCGIELLFLLAFAISLTFGSGAVQQAGVILLSGAFGWIFWGLVVVIGLLVPAAVEQLELMHVHLPFVPDRFPPILKLVGSLSLRFVIVYAGLLSFI